MASDEPPLRRGRKRRIAGWALLALICLVLLALAVVWWQRREIADDLIGDALREAGVSASYTVENISPRLQVLRDIRIGDEARPDFTARRIEVATIPRFGLPELRQVRVIGGRLYGSYRGGKLSFGALDPLIFKTPEEPFAWPDLDLVIDDGRGLMESDFGRIGLRLAGGGNLQDGFAGELALASPTLATGPCRIAEASVYGAVEITQGVPHFSGPVRFASAKCAGATLVDGAVQIDGEATQDFAAFSTDLAWRSGAATYPGLSARASQGAGAISWREGVLNTRFDATLRNVASDYARLARLQLTGRATALDSFRQVTSEGDVVATGIDLGNGLDRQLAAAASASADTLLAPLLAKARGGLADELQDARLQARYLLRSGPEATGLAIPQAMLRGRSGATLLAVSRGELAFSESGLPRVAGNFSTGGRNLPKLAGRMEQDERGALSLNARMEEYVAGSARLALPALRLTQAASGAITFAGEASASGALPGGAVAGLTVPIDGTLASNGDLALWQGCRTASFASLRYSSLALGPQRLALCPLARGPLLRVDRGGPRFAAQTNALRLAGRLGGTPLTLTSAPVRLAWPGASQASDVAIVLGQGDSANTLRIGELSANISPLGIGGSFASAQALLGPVPLDIEEISGDWTLAGGRLDIVGASLTVADRAELDRFKPVIARDAALSFANGQINASALLREPRTDTALAQVLIRHDLAAGAGQADLLIDGVTFQPRGLEPRDVSELAYGLVSLVDGTVRGSGEFRWSAAGVTSTGRFSTDRLDLAAPFGPVSGMSGTVEFTDLLGLTTAPDQRVAIAAVNPGIEIYDGVVTFALQGANVVDIGGGTWPMLGGRLRLRPLTLTLGAAEERRYVFEIDGLEAGRFVERMELNNVAASGVFDGVIPIVFDAMGNGQLIGGSLVARAPGGHLAYVGELTYEDLSWAGNLAFSALRDLRFSGADVRLDGPLTGELVTRVTFAGVGQGQTAQSNFLTRRLASLPIQLRLNIRAPFYQLISSTRSLYDPSAVRDPRQLGLIAADGTRLRGPINARDLSGEKPSQPLPDPEPIQPPASEAMP